MCLWTSFFLVNVALHPGNSHLKGLGAPVEGFGARGFAALLGEDEVEAELGSVKSGLDSSMVGSLMSALASKSELGNCLVCIRLVPASAWFPCGISMCGRDGRVYDEEDVEGLFEWEKAKGGNEAGKWGW